MVEEALDQFHGNRKGKTFAVGELHVRHTDDFAGEVEQGAAAVAGIDLRAGLQKKIAFDLPCLGAQNALGDRALQAKRAADGEH